MKNSSRAKDFSLQGGIIYGVRERVLEHGATCLDTLELLSCLLALPLDDAGEFLRSGVAQSLGNLDPLQVRSHLSPARAATLLAAVELGRRTWTGLRGEQFKDLNNPELVAGELSCIAYQEQEHFAVLLLDIKHRLISKQIVSRGTLDETIAHPRDVFRAAVRQNAASIVVGHNHPSGQTSPSQEDLRLTEQLILCGKTLQIPVLDHIIVGQGNFTSLRRATSLWGTY
jgi:DNA repair protein RadC